jgi:hypothetical protein
MARVAGGNPRVSLGGLGGCRLGLARPGRLEGSPLFFVSKLFSFIIFLFCFKAIFK